MRDQEWLDGLFLENRPRLSGVATRMLGSAAEADDVLQEAWLKVHNAAPESLDNPAAWLTTVVARLCLDVLRRRRTHGEVPLESEIGGSAAEVVVGPEQHAVVSDSVGIALLLVLDTLGPAERLAFVLHDLFGLPFEEIAPLVERSVPATRQLASRARRRVQLGGRKPDPVQARDLVRRRAVVDAFFAASKGGDLDALLALLAPDAVLRSDATAAGMGSPASIEGGRPVAEFFNGKAKAARLALLDGEPGAVWTLRGKPMVAFRIGIRFDAQGDGRVVSIDLVGDPTVLESTEFDFS